MPRFMIQGTFTPEGLRGVLKDGGSGRVAAAQKMAESVGGRLESFDFALGQPDTFVICELPDNKAAAAVALTVGASGAVSVTTRALMSSEEIDQAIMQSVEYRAPGA